MQFDPFSPKHKSFLIGWNARLTEKLGIQADVRLRRSVRDIKTLYSNQALLYMPLTTSRCFYSYPSTFCCPCELLIAWFFLTSFIPTTCLLNSCPLCSFSELCLGSRGAEAPYIFKCSGEGFLPLLLLLLLHPLMCRIYQINYAMLQGAGINRWGKAKWENQG
jgi:hypothetical protein